MNKKIWKLSCIFCMIAFLIAVIAFFVIKQMYTVDTIGEEKVLLEEIKEVVEESGNIDLCKEQIQKLENDISRNDIGEQKRRLQMTVVIIFIVVVLFIMSLILYIYLKLIRPFDRLEKYASQVASGNFDISLGYERMNFFGAFTWAFDHMREELIRAKKSEAEAIEENKTIIATLSHDIKTPIASIRAYTEGLEANLDSSYEKREYYMNIIMKKCDEVTALTNDLVLHSLSELDKIEIKENEVEISSMLESIIEDFEYSQIVLLRPLPSQVVTIDQKRFAQVIENILNNARKYATNTEITVWVQQTETDYSIHIKDHGTGIPPEDMPFVLQKFYRGHNVNQNQGSGLGLYIVNYLVTRMGGKVILNNSSQGLEVILSLKTS